MLQHEPLIPCTGCGGQFPTSCTMSAQQLRSGPAGMLVVGSVAVAVARLSAKTQRVRAIPRTRAPHLLAEKSGGCMNLCVILKVLIDERDSTNG